MSFWKIVGFKNPYNMIINTDNNLLWHLFPIPCLSCFIFSHFFLSCRSCQNYYFSNFRLSEFSFKIHFHHFTCVCASNSLEIYGQIRRDCYWRIKPRGEGKNGIRKEILDWTANTKGHLKNYMKTYYSRNFIKYMHIWKKHKLNH